MRRALLPCAACKGELPDHDHICESCAVKVCCDCASSCHDCGTDMCPKHTRSCDVCEDVTCKGCLMKCDGCKSHACDNCRVVCIECDKVFCEDCQDEHGARLNQIVTTFFVKLRLFVKSLFYSVPYL